MSDADRARWADEAKRRGQAHKDAGTLRHLKWRWRLFMILIRDPFSWKWRNAWSYARALCAGAIFDLRIGYAEEMATPEEALEADREYWEA
jgi:hypothetical protein